MSVTTTLTTGAGMQEYTIPVVYMFDRLALDGWEKDWMEELFPALTPVTVILPPSVQHPRGIECRVRYEHVMDTNRQTPRRNAVIVTSVPERADVTKYLEAHTQNKFKFAILQLADEFVRQPYKQCYSKPGSANAKLSCKLVIRTSPPAPEFMNEHVLGIPLGYKQKFWQGYTGLPPRLIDIHCRPYWWSFAGQVRPGPRQEMFDVLAKELTLPPGHTSLLHKTANWNTPDSLGTAAYRDLLLKTVFVPSPIGQWNLDCFRTYEALEAGCIPIVIKETPQQPYGGYYSSMFRTSGFTARCPILEIDKWTDLPNIMANMLQHLPAVEWRRQACHKFWNAYKEHLKKRLATSLTARVLFDETEVEVVCQSERPHHGESVIVPPI